MPGSLVKFFQVITLAGRPGEWTKRETGQRVTHRSCALLPRLMWSRPYCELYSHAVCTWKLWNYFPLSWFLYERIRLNLINPRVLKIERGVHEKKLDSAPFTVGPWKNATCLEVILLNKILRNHLLSENMQGNYASINVTLNYLLHEIMEFCVTSSLALDNWEQKYCQILGNKPNYSLRVPPGRLFSTSMVKYSVKSLWDLNCYIWINAWTNDESTLSREGEEFSLKNLKTTRKIDNQINYLYITSHEN